MKAFLFNIGYFIRETGRIIRLNLLSNIFSVIGTGLILFLLGLAVTGADTGNHLVDMLNDEAEINGYFTEKITDDEKKALVGKVEKLRGVRGARLVDENEAKEKMEKILGEESKILDLFEENPFEAYVEIHIDVDSMDFVLENVKKT